MKSLQSGNVQSYLSLGVVDVLADGGEQTTQALVVLLVLGFEQPHQAVVHDLLCQHLQLEQLANKPKQLEEILV